MPVKLITSTCSYSALQAYELQRKEEEEHQRKARNMQGARERDVPVGRDRERGRGRFLREGAKGVGPMAEEESSQSK